MPSYAIIYHLISVHMLLAIKESYHQCFKCLSSVKVSICCIPVTVEWYYHLFQGRQTEYCKKLVTWIKSCNFKQVILVSSISATERVDAQIEG